MAVDDRGDRLFPRPDFAQAAGHQADEEGDGEVMVALEEPCQSLREGYDADDRADAENAEADNVALIDRGQHKLVFAQALEAPE